MSASDKRAALDAIGEAAERRAGRPLDPSVTAGEDAQ